MKVDIQAIIKNANGDEKAKGGTPSEDAILKFLEKHPSPTDDQFHAWAESSGFNAHKAEQTAYKIIGDLLTKGRSKGAAPAGVSKENVRRGVEIEAEHTPNKMIQRKITDDHNAEFRGYYDPKRGLPKMEKTLEKGAAFVRRLVATLKERSMKKEAEKMVKCPITGKMVPASGRGMGPGGGKGPGAGPGKIMGREELKKILEKKGGAMDPQETEAIIMAGFVNELDKIAMSGAEVKGKINAPPTGDTGEPGKGLNDPKAIAAKKAMMEKKGSEGKIKDLLALMKKEPKKTRV